jgi:hypothetical protein
MGYLPLLEKKEKTVTSIPFEGRGIWFFKKEFNEFVCFVNILMDWV